MKHIKAHNIGFMTESWDFNNKLITEDYRDDILYKINPNNFIDMPRREQQVIKIDFINTLRKIFANQPNTDDDETVTQYWYDELYDIFGYEPDRADLSAIKDMAQPENKF